MTHDTSAPVRRNLLLLFVAIAVLVIVALAIVFTRGEPEVLDESTPEGVVQRYAAAVLDGDDEEALNWLSDDAREECGTTQSVTSDLRVALISTDVRENSADVRVQISQNGSGPFGSEYSYEEDVKLTREGGDWRIEVAPWELTICLMDGEIR